MNKYYKAYLGENKSDYYLKKFEIFDQNLDKEIHISWNWFAFLTILWPLYRKMYKWFFIQLGFLLTINIITGIDKSFTPLYFFYMILSIAFGIYSNSIYHKQVINEIDNAKYKYKDETDRIKYLESKGGVNKWTIHIFYCFWLIMIAALVFGAIKNNKSQNNNMPTNTTFRENKSEVHENKLGKQIEQDSINTILERLSNINMMTPYRITQDVYIVELVILQNGFALITTVPPGNKLDNLYSLANSMCEEIFHNVTDKTIVDKRYPARFISFYESIHLDPSLKRKPIGQVQCQ